MADKDSFVVYCHAFGRLVLNNSWNELVGHQTLVDIPVVAVLELALMIVTFGAVHQENSKINGIIIGHRALHAAEQTPAQAHNPIAGIIDLPSQSPPT